MSLMAAPARCRWRALPPNCSGWPKPRAAPMPTRWKSTNCPKTRLVEADRAGKTEFHQLTISGRVVDPQGPAPMHHPAGVKTSSKLPVPQQMKAWVLGDPDELLLRDKPTPVPGRAEVLVRIDAVAICAPELMSIHGGTPGSISDGLPFIKNFTPGHEYMGMVAALGPDVDEFRIGERVSVEIHAGCGQCKRCRQGMYTSCLNYGRPEKGHRANGFTTDGGFAEYAINHITTLARVPDTMSDAEATLVVTAGTSMYGLTELGGLVAGESVVVIGPGPIGLLAVAVAKALGASPVILTGTRNKRLAIGQELGADRVVNINDEDAVEVR